jgi:hypothetical protein
VDTSLYRALRESASVSDAGLARLTDPDDTPATPAPPGTWIGGPHGSTSAQDFVTFGRTPARPGQPVFVDSSGRRSRRLRRAGWILSSACACYAAVVVSSLFGGHAKAPRLLIPSQEDHVPGRTMVISPDKSPGRKSGLLPGLTPGGSGAPAARDKARRGKRPLESTSGTPGVSPASPDRLGGRTHWSSAGTKTRSAHRPAFGTSPSTGSSMRPNASIAPSTTVGASIGVSTTLSALTGLQLTPAEETG